MLTAVGIAAIALLVLWFGQRGFIYFPDALLPAPPAVGLSRAEVVGFQTEDGLDLEAWFVPANVLPAGRTVIVFNGNAGNRSQRAFLAAMFAEYGWSTLLVDYRGYGGNPGLPSERGLERDARAALRYLASRPDADLTRVAYFGESIGAAVAIRLAVEYPPSALILRSPFSSLRAIGSRHYPLLPVRFLLRDRFPSIDLVGRLECPVLMIAGDADTIVPLSDTERLFNAAREPKRLVVIADADHNDDALTAGAAVMRAISEFLGESKGPEVQ